MQQKIRNVCVNRIIGKKCLTPYSTAQPQVYKPVRATRLAPKVTHEYRTRACARHVSSELLTRESKLASVEHANTCVYSRVLAIELASIRHRTREYSQSSRR